MSRNRPQKGAPATPGPPPADARAADAPPETGRPGGFVVGDLRYRFALWLLLALLPVAALNIVQGWMALDRARDAARDQLLAGALYATAIQENTFAGAEHLLR